MLLNVIVNHSAGPILALKNLRLSNITVARQQQQHWSPKVPSHVSQSHLNEKPS
jgi:hypothetical protein